MRPSLPPVLLLTALLLAACASESSTPAALDDGADAVELRTIERSDESAEEDGAGDDGPSRASGADAEAATAPAGVADPWTTTGLAAEPGLWAVADAGTVEFDRTADGLVLVDVTAAEGWSARVDEESADEIEVEFRRDAVTHEIEIEIEDGRTDIELKTDIEPAEAGVHPIGAAGSLEFSREGGRLTLLDVVVREGWELRVDEESADEIELELVSGAERWRVEVELDDGRIELELDYRLRG